MHNAPSVIYPVGRCRFHVVVVALLALAGLGMLALWWMEVSRASAVQLWTGSVGAALWFAWSLWAIQDVRRTCQGRLEWDSRSAAVSLDAADGRGAWRWRGAGSAEATQLHHVEVAVDLQIVALLRLHAAQRPCRWAWVEQSRDPARWNDLRRALHSARH